MIWDRAGEVDVAAALRCPCRMACRGDVGWIEVLLEKTGPAPAEPAKASRRRLAAWLEASMRVLGREAMPRAAA